MSADAERRDRLTAVVTGLATLLVLSLVALLVVTLRWQSADAPDEDAAAILAAGKAADRAARAAAVEMTTYDHATIEEDFAWAEDAGTARFQEQYAEVSAPIKQLVTELKASAEGTVVASAPVVEDTSHVTVLLFLDQEITNEGAAGQQSLDQPRVSMTMVREDGRWLVDQVQLSTLDEPN